MNKRHRSAETGNFITAEEAKANPAESVEETVPPPSIVIADLVRELDPYDLATIRRIFSSCGDFPNKDALLREINKALTGLGGLDADE